MVLRRAAPFAAALCRRALATSPSSSPVAAASSSAVNSILLRSLKEHHIEVSKLNPPPKISPPEPYTIVKGTLDQPVEPVLRREYGEADEEISISVASFADILPSNILPEAVIDSDSEGTASMSGSISQLLLHVEISRTGSAKSLLFLCELYPDAVRIISVRLRSKNSISWDGVMASKGGGKWEGPIFQELDEKIRDAFHLYIEARGINEKLFPFLQAWSYVKDHRNLIRWFQSVASFISEPKQSKGSRTPSSRLDCG